MVLVSKIKRKKLFEVKYFPANISVCMSRIQGQENLIKLLAENNLQKFKFF